MKNIDYLLNISSIKEDKKVDFDIGDIITWMEDLKIYR